MTSWLKEGPWRQAPKMPPTAKEKRYTEAHAAAKAKGQKKGLGKV